MADMDEVVAEPRKSALDAEIKGPVILSPVGQLTTIAALLLGGVRQLRTLTPAAVYHIKRDGREASLVGPCMGAPVATMVLEQCIAQGARHVILMGVAGSINQKARIGDFVIATSALSEEGTSAHYDPAAHPPLAGEKALQALRQTMDAAYLKYHEGRVWTCDAFYRETKDKVVRYGQEGILAVEMELAALFTVSRYRGIEMGALMVVSDELFDLKWHTGYTNPEFLGALRLLARLSLNAALRLSEG